MDQHNLRDLEIASEDWWQELSEIREKALDSQSQRSVSRASLRADTMETTTNQTGKRAPVYKSSSGDTTHPFFANEQAKHAREQMAPSPEPSRPYTPSTNTRSRPSSRGKTPLSSRRIRSLASTPSLGFDESNGHRQRLLQEVSRCFPVRICNSPADAVVGHTCSTK